MIILLACILTCNIVLLGLLIYAGIHIYRAYIAMKSFITPIKDGEPSPMAQTLQVHSEMLARSVTAQLKTTFMGMQSVETRNVQRLQQDIAQDTLSQSGVLGALLSSYPTVTKRLTKNPQLLDMAMSLMSRAGKLNTSGNGHNEAVSPRFKF